MINKIEIKHSLGLVEYQKSLDFMEKRVLGIANNSESELVWLLNHNHIYTMGTSSSENEIINKINIPFFNSNRGGKITYHGPGQRVIYFLINLTNKKRDIRKFVTLLETSAIKVLQNFNIEAKTFNDRVGIWVIKNGNTRLKKEEKIGAIGLRVKKWITYHGLSFNINPNLEYYKNISACGLSNYSTTSMQALGINISQNQFDELYLKYFLEDLKKL